MKIILSILTSVTIWSFFNLTSYADSTIENLEQSCYDWNFQACYDLAVEYNKGEKVVKDSSKAHELFEEACEGGLAAGCGGVGGDYSAGIGVKQDIQRALYYFHKACDREI